MYMYRLVFVGIEQYDDSQVFVQFGDQGQL
jgi:hypothetical protein